jgi:ADP-ribose pyrophosphatase YjhB (NUDIX family)
MEIADYTFCPHCGARLEQRKRFGKTRPCCPTCDFVQFLDPKVAVIGFVVHDARLLLIRRAVRPAKGRWALPGGYMDAGEMPEAALKRELIEEVGLAIDIDRLLDIFPMVGREVKSPGIVLAYQATPASGAAKQALQSNDDVSAAGWFAADELPGDIAFESTRRLLAAWGASQTGQS